MKNVKTREYGLNCYAELLLFSLMVWLLILSLKMFKYCLRCRKEVKLR